MHEEYGGVVPELATREHLRNLPSVVNLALEQAQCLPSEIQNVAATQGPGLPNALMIGVKFAQGFASSLGVPFLGIHHHEAHLYSPWIAGTPPRAEFDRFAPNVSLIVSGGHTLLVWVEELLRHQVMGETVDDAAGECFDKVAKLLGLPYPGGPELDRLAAQGNPRTFLFPRPMLQDPGFDFSFSGLKTSVRYFLEKHPDVRTDPGQRADLCAGVQAAIVDVLVAKTLRAAEARNARCITVSGGVSCNRGLRSRLQQECAKVGIQLQLALPQICTDNAAMIGILAETKWKIGGPSMTESTSPDAEPRPHWSLESLAATS